jgi:DNA polymerase-3 subunit alpha (Gram-positive type)
VEVNASYKKNKYSNDELQGTIRTVKSVPIPAQFIRTDDAEKSRIELLCHTKFTAFDGVCSAGEAIARSLAFKHPGIGFCDRGNAQGFPSIAMANKNQKIFYGSELNIISKKIPIVQNLENELSKRKIDNVSYVVFDLETTGLNNEYDEITEFGGVKITNGTIQKTENFDIFIKPKQRLRDFIVAKTHITNEMLEAQGVEFEEAAKKILDYIGNSVLIAHNGRSFDFRFLNKKLVKLGYPPLKNICIDSLEVSRSINPDMTRHNLGALCKANQIKYDADSAHRADFDADVLAQVWLLFINKMKSEGIETIEDINEKLQNYTLRRRQFASYINVYAKNQKGLKDLYKLISLASTEQLNGETPTIYYEQLNDFRENIIICSNPFEGEIWDAGLNDTDENLAKIMEKYDYIFVAPASSVMHEVVKQNITMENVKVTIKRIVDIAKANNKKVCAVSDAYYLDE